ncbi:DUF2500 domain-containing protein [Bacillus sp. FJAT-29790]|uniref:DUF2500 domain-containing protein n=1 Tax=Bacillus sp. FJAT-29790 TaxID=1895002 RepID=UPI001C217D88|nr:DUF2500 domain-containing protein [Bacillus sp. FJAT-29790]MBU8878748.1 DUF2500 domain-containing protein [Bacillus sp. FJAT-29790]
MEFGPGFGFDMFSIIDAIFPIFFILIFGFIVFAIINGIKQWNHNNKQPILNVSAKLVTKRTEVSRSLHNHDEHTHHHTSTSYYATFEVESGDRMEFLMSGSEYGQLAEGDYGKLKFQGTRYLGFERWQ